MFLAVLGAVWYLSRNLVANMAASDLPRGWDFLNRPTGVDIRGVDFRPSQPVRDALVVGVLNTMRVSGAGIVMATLVGVVVGTARLSVNWFARRAAAAYVEMLRNVPVLLIIVFMYIAVIRELPEITRAREWFGFLILSNRRLGVPWLETGPQGGLFAVAVAGAVVAAALVMWWRTRLAERTGQAHHRALWGMAVLLGIVGVSFAALDAPVSLSIPVREDRIISGGITLDPEFAALLLALSLYHASHIAEIVRGSVLAVHRGQDEAGQALGLSGFQRMRFVILPQAFRIAVPPVANQYLSLTKNSSLAVAIGYFEITRITSQAIANGNPAPQLIAILMGIYLSLSLVIAAVTNVVNRRLALVEH